MRLRQAVWVARDLEKVGGELEGSLGVRDPYRDPGVGIFGLQNVVYALGDTFLEVVSPVQEGTAAGRFLERRGGDGGYMIIIQVDDIEETRNRAEEFGVRTVWQIDLPEARASHLHPKDTGGTLLSIDWMDPPESWRWGGPDWEARSAPGKLEAVELGSDDPIALASRWSDILGVPAKDGAIELDGGTIRFARGNGMIGIDVSSDQAPRADAIAGIRLTHMARYG